MNSLFAILTLISFTAAGDTLSTYAEKLVNIAQAEHATYHKYKENNPILCEQIQKYWQVVGASNIDCVQEPWSAVFVSYCVKTAGAGSDEFKFSDTHAAFVHQAIQNADRGLGVFRAVAIENYAPKPGDIVQFNRLKNTFDFTHARNNSSYPSHSVLVVKTGKGLFGKYAEIVGGNERNTVRKARVKLHKNGLIKQRKRNPYICVIKNLK